MGEDSSDESESFKFVSHLVAFGSRLYKTEYGRPDRKIYWGRDCRISRNMSTSNLLDPVPKWEYNAITWPNPLVEVQIFPSFPGHREGEHD